MMHSKILFLILALSLLGSRYVVEAQTYSTQPITAQNAPLLVPLLTWDHTAPLDTPYPVTPEPTSYYNNPVRDGFDPDFVFSPDGRYLAHIIDEPLTLWLVDLAEGTERVFPLDAANVTISPDWRTLAVTGRVVDSFDLHTYLWDMDALLALPRAPIGETANCQFRVTISSTHLRENPRVDAPSLGYALADQTYPVIATTLRGGWVQIHGDTQPAWINSQYGTLEGNCAAVPIFLIPGDERAVIDKPLAGLSPDGHVLITGRWLPRKTHTTIAGYSVNSGELLYELDIRPSYELSPDIRPSFQFSPDSRLLVDRAGQFFDTATGRRLFSLTEQIDVSSQSTEYESIFSADSRMVAMAGDDGIIRLLDTADGREMRTFTLPGGQLGGLEFSPDDRYLLINTIGLSIRQAFLWDLTSTPLHVLTTRDTDAFVVLPESVSGCDPRAFLNDGSGILVSPFLPPESDWIGVWDMNTRDFRFKIDRFRSCDTTYLMPDSAVLLFRDRFLDAQTGARLREMRLPYFWLFSPDWHWAVQQNTPEVITLWGVPANAAVPTLPPTVTQTPRPTITPTPPGFIPTSQPTSYANTANSTATVLALTPSPTATIAPTALPTIAPFVVTPQTGMVTITADNYEQITLLHTLQFRAGRPAYLHYLQFTALTPDGSRLVMAGARAVQVWDVLHGELITTISDHPGYITGLDVSQDGQYILTLAEDGVLRLWSLDTGVLVSSTSMEGWLYCSEVLKLSPDNRRVIMMERASDGSSRLRIRDMDTAALVLDEREYGGGCNIAGGFRSDGVALWWSDSYSRINIHTLSGDLYQVFEATNVVPNPDLTRLATFDTGRVNIRIWDTVSRGDPLLLEGHTAPVRDVHFSPDGQLLVSFDLNDVMLLWNAASGERLTTIPAGMLPNVMSVGGTRWLIAGADGTPLLQDVRTLLDTDLAERINSLSLSADGATLVAAAGDVVLLFGIPTAERPAYASVPVRVVPSAIHVRPQPSLAVEPNGSVTEGIVVAAGRDASGQFVYLPNANGWALADPAHIDLGSLTIEQLPIRES